jgi:hypothetical protein
MPILLTPCCDNGTTSVVIPQREDLPEIVSGNNVWCVTGITPYNSCWTASYIEASITYTGDFTFNFFTSDCNKCVQEGCPGCQEIPGVYYKLEDCQGNLPDIITNQDLSEYVDTVIKLANCYAEVCWIVSETREEGDFSVAVASEYKNCFKCLYPDQEFELEKRSLKPGFNTGKCSPEYVTKIKCNNADAIYDQMVSVRYGVTVCCETDPIKWEIKKELVELDLLYDDSLCKNLIPPCCPPTCLVVEIEPNNIVPCNPPENITVEFAIILCQDPTNLTVSFLQSVLNPLPVDELDRVDPTPIGNR